MRKVTACCVYSDYEGRFRGATKLKGIKDFQAKDYGLVPIKLDTWGQFVFIMTDPSRCAASFGNHMPCSRNIPVADSVLCLKPGK